MSCPTLSFDYSQEKFDALKAQLQAGHTAPLERGLPHAAPARKRRTKSPERPARVAAAQKARRARERASEDCYRAAFLSRREARREERASEVNESHGPEREHFRVDP